MAISEPPSASKQAAESREVRRIWTGIAIVLTAFGVDASGLAEVEPYDHSKTELPPMPGSLPYFFWKFRDWLKTKFGTPERSGEK